MDTRRLRPICRGGLLGAIAALALGWPGLAQPLPSTPAQSRPTGVPTAPAVRQLQRQLAQVDLYQGAIDGLYGPETAQAVRSFQQQQGLPVDGLVGPQTQSALAMVVQGPAVTLPPPLLRAEQLSFSLLVVAQPNSPPSALWLSLMPLVPITGGTITYLHRRLWRRWRILRRRDRLRRLPSIPRPRR